MSAASAQTSRLTSEQWADKLCADHTAFYRQNPTGEILPMCIAEGTAGVTMIACPWDSAVTRQLILVRLRALLRDMGATRYAFYSEAWVSSRPAGTPLLVQPKDDPERLEVLTILVVERGCEPVGRSLLIKRDRPDGPVTGLELQTGAHWIGGDLISLLEPARTAANVH